MNTEETKRRIRPTARSRRAEAPRPDPEISIVIPVLNEEAIVERQVRALVAETRTLNRPFEVILSANGCTDQTITIAQELARTFREVQTLELSEPDYGRALRAGILAARGRIVVCDEIDLCDVDFHRRALRLLDQNACDMVVGSKTMPGARDKRPLTRRVATKVINGMLRLSVGFQGTDTHGLKAFRRAPMLPVIQRCVVNKDLFASELVIRAGRAGLRVHEIPIELEEQRSSPIHLVRRVPRVLRDLGRLVVAVRFGRTSRDNASDGHDRRHGPVGEEPRM